MFFQIIGWAGPFFNFVLCPSVKQMKFTKSIAFLALQIIILGLKDCRLQHLYIFSVSSGKIFSALLSDSDIYYYKDIILIFNHHIFSVVWKRTSFSNIQILVSIMPIHEHQRCAFLSTEFWPYFVRLLL
jgi:hypothetical protein